MTLSFVPIFFRWLHVASACILIGSVFFYDLILPLGMRGLDASAQELLALRARLGFKMTVHVTLLLFLISGIYNAIKAWPIYTSNPGLMHAMFGLHVLLGLGAIAVLMIALAGREPKRTRAGWTRWALLALLLGTAAAATLKSAREWTITHPQTAPAKVALHYKTSVG
jgi:uncharacterized membrane protein